VPNILKAAGKAASIQPLVAYGVDPLTGFVPRIDPLDRLRPEFDAWEEVAGQLAPLIRSRRLRSALTDLPEVGQFNPGDARELERAFLILTVLANAWVWGGSEPDLRIPAVLAGPLCALGRMLDRPPIVHYASMALNNWRRVQLSVPLSADNMRMQIQFLGGVDEDWFFIASLGVELAAAPAIAAAHAATQASLEADDADLAMAVGAIAAGMAGVIAAVARIREWCDPYIYYQRVRPYFAGWPDPGVIYEGVSPEPVRLVGGSAGQSSVMQALDAVLGVEHPSPETGPYLRLLRRYMPVGHRRFVDDAERHSRVRARASSGSPALRDAYNAAVEQVDLFRRRHIGLAHDFIVKPSGMAEDKGTGGTSFVDFLRDARIETAQARL
jgi:indoleamine 2,3-dioxygenase